MREERKKSGLTEKISAATVRTDFNDLPAVIYYTRAAHELGLWQSERVLIDRFFPDQTAPLLEAGCGAGRVTLGLWSLGFTRLTAFDFAEELIDQARSLAAERRAGTITFLVADATDLRSAALWPAVNNLEDGLKPRPAGEPPLAEASRPGRDLCHPLDDKAGITSSQEANPGCHLMDDKRFSGGLFMFNGLMQIPGRENRRAALRELHRVCLPGAPLLFTTHDRDSSPTERAMWRLETLRWVRGEQDPRLVEFGDRYFVDHSGRTFMHLPDRAEILADLAVTGWTHAFDAMRREIAPESHAVHDFSDECRFWAAHRRS